MSKDRIALVLVIFVSCMAPMVVWAVTENFDTFILGTGATSQPLSSGDHCPVIQGGVTKNAACNIFVTLTDSQTVTNKTINCANNPCTIRGNLDVINQVQPANGGTGLASGVSGGVLCATASTTYAFSGALTANTPLIGGGAGACPGVGSVSGNTTKFVSNTGSTPSGQGGSWDANGNWIANSAAVYSNVAQTFGPQQIFGSVKGKLRTQSSASDTLDTSTASTSDCGGTVLYTNTNTVTVTLPASGTPPCSIALEQGSTGRVALATASGATFTSVHGFTGTFNGAGAIIGLFMDTNVGGSAAHYVLTGDAQ